MPRPLTFVNARKRRSGRAEPERLLPCDAVQTIVSPKRVAPSKSVSPLGKPWSKELSGAPETPAL